MEERARYGSRKFLGFSATRRKELSAGHNGQAVISFTRRIPRPSVLHEDKKKCRPPSSPLGKEKISRLLRARRIFRAETLETEARRCRDDAVEFSRRQKFVMKNLIRRGNRNYSQQNIFATVSVLLLAAMSLLVFC